MHVLREKNRSGSRRHGRIARVGARARTARSREHRNDIVDSGADRASAVKRSPAARVLDAVDPSWRTGGPQQRDHDHAFKISC